MTIQRLDPILGPFKGGFVGVWRYCKGTKTWFLSYMLLAWQLLVKCYDHKHMRNIFVYWGHSVNLNSILVPAVFPSWKLIFKGQERHITPSSTVLSRLNTVWRHLMVYTFIIAISKLRSWCLTITHIYLLHTVCIVSMMLQESVTHHIALLFVAYTWFLGEVDL